jgi:ABC-type amino acid transport substrate-binding protein
LIHFFRQSALLLCLAAFCCASSGSTAQADERLTIGVMKGAKPGSYRNEKGEMTGFSVDVGLALCKIINANCTLVEMGSLQELIDAVANDQVDFAPASLLETPERSARMLFTTPYFRSSSYLVARKGVSLTTAGLRVVVLNGARQMDYLRATLGKDQQVMPVATVPDLVNALEKGLADASVLAMFQATTVISESKLITNGFILTPLDVPELTGDAKIAVTRAKPQLRDRLNEALKIIRSNGTLEQINSRHIPFRVI